MRQRGGEAGSSFTRANNDGDGPISRSDHSINNSRSQGEIFVRQSGLLEESGRLRRLVLIVIGGDDDLLLGGGAGRRGC